jgi:hypothetical protein
MSHMFSGLDSIDWGSMQHAYGPATEVPALLRALVSDDPKAREYALDGMYGSVHHQGDVYDCTVAAIPFLLEAAAMPLLPGRGGVLELLASIGGADLDDLVAVVGRPTYEAAERAVEAAYPLFLELLDDPDPEVRRAAPKALQAGRNDAGRIVTALLDRPTGAEADPGARAAVIAAMGTFGRRAAAGQFADVDPAVIGAWLADIAGDPDADPQTRLAALAELACCAPDRFPPDAVASTVGLLRTVYAAGSPPAQPAGFSTDSLVGALREMSEGEAAGRLAPQAAELVRRASVSLGDRVEERVQLLTQLLREPGWEVRYDALRPAKVLIEGWRGSYEELVFLLGEQLLDPHPRLPAVAASALEYLDVLAAPAADALAAGLEAAPRESPHTRQGGLPGWVTTWPGKPPAVGRVLRTLIQLRDPRALPAVRWILERRTLPREIGGLVGHFGAGAAALVPLIRQRLQDQAPAGRGSPRLGLVIALSRIGPAAVALPHLLALPPGRPVLRALGELGPGAADALPALRQMLDHGQPDIEIAAAAALWRITADPTQVLPVQVRHLDSAESSDRMAAARALAELGPAAASAAPALQRLLDAADAAWLRLAAAGALWRTTGEVSRTLPTLTAAWSENPHTRTVVADYLAEMGEAAATAAPLLHAELERRRRHTAREHGWSSDQVRSDLALLRACNRALAATAPQ